MRIEHAAMYVNNLERAKSFFEKYFNAVSSEEYLNQKTKFRSYFLSFDGGARLILHRFYISMWQILLLSGMLFT